MTFQTGDKIRYNLTKREYLVDRCYRIKHDDLTLELVDVIPLVTTPGDKHRTFKGWTAEHFTLVKSAIELAE